MRSHFTVRLAWSLWTLTVVFSAVSLIIAEQGSLVIMLPLGAWSSTSSTVGTIIVSRRPENPIGWILGAIGFLWACNIFSGLYAIHALVTSPGSLPAGEVAAWVATWVVWPAFGLLAYLFLLFPDGRPLSSRWRPLLWITGILIAVDVIVNALNPGPITGLEGARNPLGIEG
jgi:two-component system NarL family sensor kinase